MNVQIVRRIMRGLYASLAALAVLAGYSLARLPSVPDSGGRDVESLAWPDAPASEGFRPSVFKSSASSDARTDPGELRYRLAGTFLEYGDPDRNQNRSRRAILDDLEQGRQVLVEEGESHRDIDISRISRDHILVEKDGRLHELWLSFNRTGERIADADAGAGDAIEPANEAANRFGRRVGDTRWVFEKQALRDFYAELMDDPARAVDIYETMRPDYDADENIQGYVVDMVGEQDFFHAVGLENGDVVRKVNSMEMRSRQRAEYFIKEFMKDRVNAVVLDIERDGEEKKLVYLLR